MSSVTAVNPKKSRPSKKTTGASAEQMASRQREISVSEFFAKNRHLLGFDNGNPVTFFDLVTHAFQP